MARIGVQCVALFLVGFAGIKAQNQTTCQNATVQQAILSHIKDAFISGMERRMASPIKMALSVNGIPKDSIPRVKMNWFITDPINFPNASRFPAEAYPGVTVDPILYIAPGRGQRERGGFYTLKSSITFTDRTIVDSYILDFEVHALNPCFDVKFTLHNVGRLSMPDLGGFRMVPAGPRIHTLSNRVYKRNMFMSQTFNMTLEYLEEDQSGNRAELRKESSRLFCVKAPFDPSSESNVIGDQRPSYSLTDDSYQVSDMCYTFNSNKDATALFQNHILLFDKGTGPTRFTITMTTSTEIVTALENLSPSIYVRLGNSNRTDIATDGTDQAPISGKRSYEVLVIGYPTPTVSIATPRGQVLLKTYINGRSYHRAFLLLPDVNMRDQGVYHIKANNTGGLAEFTFNVQVMNTQ
ncbi:uncharacterized protein LOC135484413 [Lineus longissimus]|uniref:uncharacterized protein LOC135484411 n=1 Tax=Lineus longissimus TaxID=88925 RepID=UPI002B4C4DA4